MKKGLQSAAFAYHTTQCFTFTLLYTTPLHPTPLHSTPLHSYLLLFSLLPRSSPRPTSPPARPFHSPPSSFFLPHALQVQNKNSKEKKGELILFCFYIYIFRHFHGIGHTTTATPLSYCWCLASSPLSPSSQRWWKKGLGEFNASAAYCKVGWGKGGQRE